MCLRTSSLYDPKDVQATARKEEAVLCDASMAATPHTFPSPARARLQFELPLSLLPSRARPSFSLPPKLILSAESTCDAGARYALASVFI